MRSESGVVAWRGRGQAWRRTLVLCWALIVMCSSMQGCGPEFLQPPEQSDPPLQEDAPPQEQEQQPPEEELAEPNSAPLADAGADQSASGDDLVQLDGTASSDPDGDALSFLWEQVGGSAVSLLDAATATPSFTAPDEDTALEFELTVEDDLGATATDSVIITVTAQIIPQLFIANFAGNNVTSYIDPATVNGNVFPDTNLQGLQTLLTGPADIVVNAEGELLVSNFTAPSITTYVEAETTNGNLSPDANVAGAATQLTQPVTLAMSQSEDLVFVADIGTNQIYTYEETTTSSFNGNVAPLRVIHTTTSADLQTPLGINMGANDDLYVANNGGNNVLVFAGASNLNGDLTPSRIISSASFGDLFDVYIDRQDRMFVVNSAGGGNQIQVFEGASSLNGTVAPDFTLIVPGAVLLTAIAVDSDGTGYVVDAGAHAVYAYDGVGEINGTVTPDRTIQGANTQLSQPIRVYLVE